MKPANVPSEQPAARLRVAAYIRVSTALDMQENSFETQERYFTDKIHANPDWRMVGIYADYGATGTCREKRPGFQRLMRHCGEGKIDRVLCKSLSRFARNALDMLDAVRKLKEMGVCVYFEKENLDSLSVPSEFVLSTIAAIAQDESRSISENIRLAYKHRSAAGDLPMPRILGYRLERAGKRGPQTVTVDPAEAETVRYIFRAFAGGAGMAEIADALIRQGRRDKNGALVWSCGKVKAVLANEKYTGDLRFQKSYTADYLTHKVRPNRGEREQKLIENHHEAIVDRETWLAAQARLFPRPGWSAAGGGYPLTGRLHCACGANLQRTNGRGRLKWVCGRRRLNGRLCEAEGIFEDDLVESLKPAFVRRFGAEGNVSARRLLLGLKAVQAFDNVEQRRVMMKRRIAAAEPAARAALEKGLERQERLWERLESDRPLRAGAIEWLKGMEDRRATTAQLLRALDAALLRAWFVDGVLDGDRLTALWLDGGRDEIALVQRKKNPLTERNH